MCYQSHLLRAIAFNTSQHSAIWLYPVPQDVEKQIWNTLVFELSKDTVRHLVAAICDHEHAVVILRFVAVCRLTGW